MERFTFIQKIQDWSDQYPWLEMLTSLSMVILLAILATFIAKQVVVRGIRKLIAKLPFFNDSIIARHSVIRRITNIVPAVVLMNGIKTVPHVSAEFISLVQTVSQAFIFLTIALAISAVLNIFN